MVRGFFVETCRKGLCDDIAMRLRRGADINSYEASTGHTGMHVAAANAHVDAMALLLENGADANAKDRNLETPLLLATRTGQIDSVQFLIKNRANVNATDRMGRNALMFAIKRCVSERAKQASRSKTP